MIANTEIIGCKVKKNAVKIVVLMT